MVLNLQKIRVENFITLKDAEFDFVPGITKVGGENRTGKSLLFKAVDSILYPRTATKAGLVELTANDWRFTVEQKKSSRSYLATDGKEEIKKQKPFLDQIGKMCTIPDSLYSSTVRLEGAKPHPLAVLRPAQRSEWLSEVFMLNLYDELKKEVEALYRELRDDKVKREVYQGQLDAIVIPDKPKGLDKARKDFDALQSEYEELKDKYEVINRVELAKERLRLGKTAKECNSLLKSKAKELKELNKNLSSMEQSGDEWESYKEWESRRKAVLKKLKKLKGADLPKTPSSKLEAKLKKAEKSLDELNEEADQWEDQKPYRKWLKGKSKPKLAKKDMRSLEIGEANLEASCQTLTDQLQELKDAKVGKCPTCGNKLSKAHRDKEVKAVGKNLKEAKAVLGEYREAIEYVKHSQAVTINEKPASTNDLEDKIEVLKAQLKALDIKERLEEELKEVESEKVRKPKTAEPSSKNLSRLHKEVEKVSREVKDLENDLRVWEEMPTTSISPKDFKKIKSRYRNIVEELLTAKEKVQRMVVIEDTRRESLKDQAKLVEEIASLEKALKNELPLEALLKACGRDGIRMSKMQEIASVLQHYLDEAAPLLWSEPFRFFIELEAGKFDLVVERNGIKDGLSSLSGSETRGWQLLSAISLLRMMPDNRRCNTIVLDELEATMDPKTITRFAGPYLEALQQVVPNIVVVSPLTQKQFPIDSDRECVVIKERGHSRLEWE